MTHSCYARGIVALLLLVPVSASTSRADDIPSDPEPIPLWPGVAPGEKGDIGPEVNAEATAKKVRLTNVIRPTITLHYPPFGAGVTGAAVLVCPGGGYNRLAMDIEGTEICEWLNEQGIIAALLKYRVPRREGLEKHVAPLQDAQRAMGILRLNAREWGIDPLRIGVIGFSAGGHLAAMLSTSFQQRTYPAVDDADAQKCRPNFAMLIYPFYLTGEGKTPGLALAPEFRIAPDTPRTFIVMTQDDRVEYAYAYALALKQAKVPAELHVYPAGGHGYGLGKGKGAVSAWPARAGEWLESNGWLTRRRPDDGRGPANSPSTRR